tara:strand:+ start:1371 stop:1595 length:225 start_codon:yes stop_codon:yes gene_type:complete
MWEFIKRLFGRTVSNIPVMTKAGEIWSPQKQAVIEAVAEAAENAAEEPAVFVKTAPVKRKKRAPAKKTPVKKSK